MWTIYKINPVFCNEYLTEEYTSVKDEKVLAIEAFFDRFANKFEVLVPLRVCLLGDQ